MKQQSRLRIVTGNSLKYAKAFLLIGMLASTAKGVSIVNIPEDEVKSGTIKRNGTLSNQVKMGNNTVYGAFFAFKALANGTAKFTKMEPNDTVRFFISRNDQSDTSQNASISVTKGSEYRINVVARSSGQKFDFEVSVPKGSTPDPDPTPTTKPDLAPYTPSGWSSSLVLATSSDSTYNTSTTFKSTDTLYLNWAVVCSGADIKQKFYTALYVDGKYITRWETDGLNLGYYAHSLTGYSLGNLSAGSHTIKLVTDVYGKVAESNEGNNTITKTIYVEQGAKPDLASYTPSGWSSALVVATSSGSTYNTSTTFKSTDALYVSWTVGCDYAAISKKFYMALYIDGKYRTRWEQTMLDKDRYTSRIGYSLGRLSPGYHTVKLTIDVYNAIAETSESNNTITKTIYVEQGAKPDLMSYTPSGWSSALVVATSSDSTYNTSTSFDVSDTLYVNWAVVSSGAATSQKFYTALYIDGNYRTRWETNGLDKDYYFWAQGYSLGRLSPGYHTVKLVTDVYGKIDETNESNNTISRTIYISGSYPDLVFYTPDGWSSSMVITTSSSSTYDTSTSFSSSSTLYLNWAVLSSAAATSQKFYTALYIDGNYRTRWETNGLDKDYYAWVKGCSLGRLSSGYHTVKLVTDVYGKIGESNESNNTITKTIYVW